MLSGNFKTIEDIIFKDAIDQWIKKQAPEPTSSYQQVNQTLGNQNSAQNFDKITVTKCIAYYYRYIKPELAKEILIKLKKCKQNEITPVFLNILTQKRAEENSIFESSGIQSENSKKQFSQSMSILSLTTEQNINKLQIPVLLQLSLQTMRIKEMLGNESSDFFKEFYNNLKFFSMELVGKTDFTQLHKKKSETYQLLQRLYDEIVKNLVFRIWFFGEAHRSVDAYNFVKNLLKKAIDENNIYVSALVIDALSYEGKERIFIDSDLIQLKQKFSKLQTKQRAFNMHEYDLVPNLLTIFDAIQDIDLNKEHSIEEMIKVGSVYFNLHALKDNKCKDYFCRVILRPENTNLKKFNNNVSNLLQQRIFIFIDGKILFSIKWISALKDLIQENTFQFALVLKGKFYSQEEAYNKMIALLPLVIIESELPNFIQFCHDLLILAEKRHYSIESIQGIKDSLVQMKIKTDKSCNEPINKFINFLNSSNIRNHEYSKLIEFLEGIYSPQELRKTQSAQVFAASPQSLRRIISFPPSQDQLKDTKKNSQESEQSQLPNFDFG